jgi:pentatricopeptide repeat protein
MWKTSNDDRFQTESQRRFRDARQATGAGGRYETWRERKIATNMQLQEQFVESRLKIIESMQQQLERARASKVAVDAILAQLVELLCTIGRVDEALVYLQELSQSSAPDLRVINFLIIGYGKLGRIAEARATFDQAVRNSPHKGTLQFAYHAMLETYIRVDDLEGAYTLYQEGRAKNVDFRDKSYHVLSKELAAGRLLSEALGVFEDMRRAGFRASLLLYNALIHACSQAGREQHASRLLQELMQGGNPGVAGTGPLLRPDGYTFTSYISRNRVVTAKEGIELFEKICDTPEKATTGCYAALLKLLLKRHKFAEAILYFERMKKHHKPDGPLYGLMISALGGNPSIEHFNQMLQYVDELKVKGIPMNDQHYRAMIERCRLHGRLQEGQRFFEEAKSNSLATPEVWNAMLVLLEDWAQDRAVDFKGEMDRASIPVLRSVGTRTVSAAHI